MFVGYAQSSSLKEALAKTFDGKNPCALCKAVSEGLQTEKEQKFLLPLVKIEALQSVTVIVLTPQNSTLIPAPIETDAAIRPESPPSPPPESA